MALTERAILGDPRLAARTLARELEGYQDLRGSELACAWRRIDEVPRMRDLVVAIKQHGRQGRACRTELELADLAFAVIDAVVDEALVARVHRDFGEGAEADMHALEVLRRGRATLKKTGAGGAPEAKDDRFVVTANRR